MKDEKKLLKVGKQYIAVDAVEHVLEVSGGYQITLRCGKAVKLPSTHGEAFLRRFERVDLDHIVTGKAS